VRSPDLPETVAPLRFPEMISERCFRPHAEREGITPSSRKRELGPLFAVARQFADLWRLIPHSAHRRSWRRRAARFDKRVASAVGEGSIGIEPVHQQLDR
jgi:hypothetical protein